MQIAWDCIIVDESILIKNRKAKRTEIVKKLVQHNKAKYCWLLSGSPASKYYDDLWAQLNILDPARFSSYWRFAEEYCYVEQDQWGWHILGNRPDAAERLKRDLADIYFSRTLDQIVSVPDWVFDDVYVKMDKQQDKIYGQMEDTFYAELGNGTNLMAPNQLAQMTRLVELASNPVLVGGIPDSAKWSAVMELLEYEQLPAIIWTCFISTADNLCNELSKKYRVAKLTGKTSAEDRQKAVDEFQAGNLDIIVAHPGVGKFGLTLTAAKTAIYLERTYNADDYYQSLYRVRRIGTKQSPHIIHLMSTRQDGSNTVDYVIGKILETRKNNAVALSEGEIKSLFEDAKNG
jgi:SNF2 family DNA or RNA helicase